MDTNTSTHDTTSSTPAASSASGALVATAPPIPGNPLDPQTAVQRLLAAFLAGRSPCTIRAYKADVSSFATFTGDATPEAAAARLLASGPGPANGLVLEFRNSLLARGLSPATISRKVSALKSLTKLARVLGLITWHIEIGGLGSEPYRNTAGPGIQNVRLMMEVLKSRSDRKGVRDYALVRALFDLGLRRAEAVSLDLAHLDLVAGSVSIVGKGRRERSTLTLPQPTRQALGAWVALRGGSPGPLFTSDNRGRKGDGRLTGSAVYAIVRQLGEAVGVKSRPHGLRHAAVSRLLELTGGDVRQTQLFSRHRKVETVLKYADNLKDTAGELSRRLAADV